MPQTPNTAPMELTPAEISRVLRRRAQANGAEVELPPDAAVADDHRNPRRGGAPAVDETEVGLLVQAEPRHAFESLVLSDETKADVLAGIRTIENRAALDEAWGLAAIQPMAGRCILNFYGDPGTGKTRTVMAIAQRLGKPVYQVDYASIISKYLGDTAKHIKQAFARAKAHGAILFFDEADSLLSRRVDMNESCATSVNQNRNVLMQELDRFDGIVLMTTNLFGNYDEALLRRIARHIEFRLPTAAQRKAILDGMITRRERVSADLAVVADEAQGLSGGDLLNVVVNGMHAASTDANPANWRLTTELLLAEVRKIRSAKAKHSGKSDVDTRPIGFSAQA